MRACFSSFKKPHGKILRNHSISLQDRSDSEIEGGWRNTPKTITIRGICHNAGAHMDEVHTAMVFDRVAVKPDELGGSERPSPRNKAKWKAAEGDWQLLTPSPMITAIKKARVLSERFR